MKNLALVGVYLTIFLGFSGQSPRADAPGMPPLGQPTAAGGGPAEASTVAEAEGYLYVLASSAHTSGLLSTMWLSDVVIHNPARAVEVNAELFFLKSGQDGTSSAGLTFTVPQGTSISLEDVVGTTFAQSKASGAILVAADGELMVTSRTFNNDASGTYGQYIEGYPAHRAIVSGEEVRLIQLTKNADFRTNIGFVNATGSSLAVSVDLHHADSTVLGSRNYTIKPWSYFQETDIIGDMTSADVDDAFAVVSSLTPGARYFTYAAVADNRTGDPIQVVPAVESSGTPIYLPGAAHVTGYGGAKWRTDLEVHNPGATEAAFTIDLLERDASNSSPTTMNLTLLAGRSVRYDDALSSVFSFTGAATLRITPTAGTVAATQRTYNDQANGTYGQYVGGLPATASIGPGESVRLVQLSQSSSDTIGFRTNIGVVNASAVQIVVSATLYRGDGTVLGSRGFTVPPYGYQQQDKIYRDVTTSEVTDGFAVLETTTEGGAFFAYAAVVDNRSGDGVTVPTQGGGTITVYLPGMVPLTLVKINAGTFQMGSPTSERGRESTESPHQVTLSQDYFIGKYEATQEQWLAVMGSNPSQAADCGLSCPVESVSWEDICGTGVTCGTSGGFIAALSQYLAGSSQYGSGLFRLPTEAEWEYAARAGTTTRFSHGDVLECGDSCEACSTHEKYMWWCGNAQNRPHPVGQKLPNPWLLYDMHGNVWEWVLDWWTSYPSYAVTDPTGPATGTWRVVRGGSYVINAAACRAARRGYDSPDGVSQIEGFRLALSR